MAPMSYDSSRLIDVASIGFSNVTPEYLNSLTDIYKDRIEKEYLTSNGRTTGLKLLTLNSVPLKCFKHSFKLYLWILWAT